MVGTGGGECDRNAEGGEAGARSRDVDKGELLKTCDERCGSGAAFAVEKGLLGLVDEEDE